MSQWEQKQQWIKKEKRNYHNWHHNRLQPSERVTRLCLASIHAVLLGLKFLAQVQKEAREIPLPSPVPRAVNNLVASRAAVRSFVMQWKTIYISSMIDGS